NETKRITAFSMILQSPVRSFPCAPKYVLIRILSDFENSVFTLLNFVVVFICCNVIKKRLTAMPSTCYFFFLLKTLTTVSLDGLSFSCWYEDCVFSFVLLVFF